MSECRVDNCLGKVRSLGLCGMHYARHLRTGAVGEATKRRAVTPAESLLLHSTAQGECILWTGSKLSTGYGQMRIKGKTLLAHRVSYENTYGAVPPKMVIDHICHNRSCIKPSHLRAVTQKQNLENNGHPNKNSKSGVRGVFWSSKSRRYVARVYHNGKPYYVGSYTDLDQAGEAARQKRIELFTHNDLDRTRSAR